MSKITHAALYAKLRDDGVLRRAKQYAHWTIPQLMAEFNGSRSNTVLLERDYQEVGALLVNHLASKLAGILFPSNRPFFKTKLSAQAVQEAVRTGITETELNSELARIEMDACQRLFLNAAYNQLVMMLKHLIVTGNALIVRLDGQTATYGLESFVVRRDGKGKLLDLVLKELQVVEGLPYEVQQALRLKDKNKYSRPEAEVAVYTRVHRELVGGQIVYVASQEVDVLPVGEPSTYPEDQCPYLVPTWNLIIGENYGRGLVEDYAGGFAKLSDLSEAATLYGIEMARVVHLVNASSGTDVDDLANAETGEYIQGDGKSVLAHESGDAPKLSALKTEINEVEQRLSRAFMYQANTRDAERVTAYELQQAAQEAEQALGGVYSSLAEQVQGPLAKLLIIEENPAIMADFITGKAKLSIVAGIPALGRISDVQNLLLGAKEFMALAQLGNVDPRVSPQALFDMVMSGRSVDTARIFYSEEQQAERADAMAQQAAGQAQMTSAASLEEQMAALSQPQQGIA